MLPFVAITFAATWSLWWASAVLRGGTFQGANSLTGPAGWIFLAGVFMPAFVAVSLTLVIEGGPAARRLLRRAVAPPPRLWWFLFALLFVAAVRLTAAAAHRLLLGAWPPFGSTPFVLMLAGSVASAPFQAGEEIGWRGYLLPRLAARAGRPAASVLAGVVWAVWHLPLFLVPGAATAGQSFPVYLLNVAGLSVAIAWVYWRTNQSVLTAMVMHAAANNTKDVVPVPVSAAWEPFGLTAAPISWLSVAVLWAAAAAFLPSMRRTHMSPSAIDVRRSS